MQDRTKRIELVNSLLHPRTAAEFIASMNDPRSPYFKMVTNILLLELRREIWIDEFIHELADLRQDKEFHKVEEDLYRQIIDETARVHDRVFGHHEETQPSAPVTDPDNQLDIVVSLLEGLTKEKADYDERIKEIQEKMVAVAASWASYQNVQATQFFQTESLQQWVASFDPERQDKIVEQIKLAYELPSPFRLIEKMTPSLMSRVFNEEDDAEIDEEALNTLAEELASRFSLERQVSVASVMGGVLDGIEDSAEVLLCKLGEIGDDLKKGMEFLFDNKLFAANDEEKVCIKDAVRCACQERRMQARLDMLNAEIVDKRAEKTVLEALKNGQASTFGAGKR